MATLKEKFAKKAMETANEVKQLLKEHGDKVISEVTITQAYGGMRGIKSLVTDTSALDPAEGISFRGYPLTEALKKLPKAEGGTEALPEGIFYLMLIGELPTQEDVKEISQEWAKRGKVPERVFKALDALPKTTHPMTQLSVGILALQEDSVFVKAYREGISKKDYWDPTYEDTMNLIAKLPQVAAYIYHRTYKETKPMNDPDPALDWAANFAKLMELGDDFTKLARLYLTIHVDHEGGNVSAHTTHLVGSTLSDAYLSLSAGMNGLAGPLHGLANQEVLRWILDMQKELGGGTPSKEQISEYVHKTLSEGKVVPGYGHAVLRKTDPRFTAQMEFGKKHCPDDETVNVVWNAYEVIPDILRTKEKIKNPWPNVDAHSGALLKHYGLNEFDYYTVMFGISRALGVLAQLCWDRALGLPLERPKSVTTEWLKSQVSKGVTA